MKPFKLLDEVLKFLYENQTKYKPDEVREWMEKNGILDSHEDFDEENTYMIESVLHRLVEDKNVYQKVGYYNITFWGQYFYETGGYTKKEENEILARSALEIANAEAKSNQHSIHKWTRRATWAAWFLFAVEVLKLILERIDLVWCNC